MFFTVYWIEFFSYFYFSNKAVIWILFCSPICTGVSGDKEKRINSTSTGLHIEKWVPWIFIHDTLGIASAIHPEKLIILWHINLKKEGDIANALFVRIVHWRSVSGQSDIFFSALQKFIVKTAGADKKLYCLYSHQV